MSTHEQRFLEGCDLAARALYLDAVKVHALSMPFHEVQLRAKPDGTGGSVLHFTGYASVYDKPYEMQDWLGSYTEVMRAGAAKKTLGEGADVAFLLNHGGHTLARTKPGTLRLSEDSTGLLTDADLSPKDPVVQSIESAMERGDMDEMSLAFWTTRQEWSPDYEQRDLVEINLHKGDVSLVNYGANPHTAGATLLSRQVAQLARSTFPGLVRQRVAAAVRAGGLTPEVTETLTHVLQLISAADGAVDVAQPLLAEVLGVANPDLDDYDDDMGVDGAAMGMLSLYAARARALAL